MVWSHFREVNFNFRIMDRMLGILKVKMSLEYPTFETAFESGLVLGYSLERLPDLSQP